MSSPTLLLVLVALMCAKSQPSRESQEETTDFRFVPSNRGVPFTQTIRRPKGTAVTLKCSVSHCNHHRSHFKWETKTSPGANGPRDDFNSKSEWTRVPANETQIFSCQGNEKISNLKLEIEKNVIYRCSVNNKVAKVYQLEIEGPHSPEILELTPSETSIPIDSQLIIQCTVFSQSQPLQIFWFKQCEGPCPNHVLYNGTRYSKADTTTDTAAVRKDSYVYVSKLNIRKTRPSDGGVYACVGVNENSFEVATSIVRVSRGPDPREPRASFSLLFLIPLAFASIPITVWLCYYRNRRKHRDRVKGKFIKVNEMPAAVPDL